MTRIYLTALLPALALGLAAPALAETAMLKFDDLDLSTDAGRAKLKDRIETAARKACTPEALVGSRIRPEPNEDCVRDAKAEMDRKFVRAATAVPTFAGRDPVD